MRKRLALSGSRGHRRATWRRRATRVVRVVFVVLALCALLSDFVSPLTPTPIAVAGAKESVRPCPAAVATAAAWSFTITAYSLCPADVLAVFVGHTDDPVGLTCQWRC